MKPADVSGRLIVILYRYIIDLCFVVFSVPYNIYAKQM